MSNFDLIKECLSKKGYEYKQFIGRGGFSCVLLCQNNKYNQYFAVKRATKHKLTEFEYNNLISLNHPNIIKLYDAFIDPVAQYLVMEYCSNGTIQQRGRLSYEQFTFFAKQILEAVAYCHFNNIAHRDIKPENIFFDQYDNIKLADFGMAKKFKINAKSKDKCGSLMFMPPEFFNCNEICPFKADIWALGITFFFMTTGTYPFQSQDSEEIKNMISNGDINLEKYKIHPEIKNLISKMIEKDFNDRLTADELLRLPIFSNAIKKPQTIFGNPGYRTKSSTKINKLTSFDVLTSQNHQAEILSYRKINLNPKIDKINRRWLMHNTF